MQKILRFVVCIVLCIALALPAAAKQETKQIDITYRSIGITLDGAAVTPTDASGNAVAPFIYAGTTYLPVRGIANALGLGVAWDGATSTITLTSGAVKANASPAASDKTGTKSCEITYRNIKIVLDGNLLTPLDAAGSSVEPFLIEGTTYLPVRAIAEALGLSVNWDSTTGTVILTTKATDADAAPQKTDSTENEQIVYITETGKRYHSSSTCNGGTYFKSTLADALKRGLTPCKKCIGG